MEIEQQQGQRDLISADVQSPPVAHSVLSISFCSWDENLFAVTYRCSCSDATVQIRCYRNGRNLVHVDPPTHSLPVVQATWDTTFNIHCTCRCGAGVRYSLEYDRYGRVDVHSSAP